MAHVAIIYRNNTLFGRYIPRVAQALQEDGHMVTVHAFPEGTWSGEMSSYVAPEGSVIFSDNTYCQAKWGFEGHLDSIFRHLTESAIRGQIQHGYWKTEDAYLQTLKHLVAEALKNGATEPKKISVAQCKLRDHKGQLGWASDKDAADMVAGWFHQLFPDAVIETMADAEIPIGESHWLVADRHHVTNEDVERWGKFVQTGLVLRLPLETTHLDLALGGLVSKDEVEFVNKLCSKFRREIALELEARRKEAG